MRRSVKVSLNYLTVSKRKRLNDLLSAYSSTIQTYIDSLWVLPGRLDKETLDRVGPSETKLSARFKSNALKQALETVIATRRSEKATGFKASKPEFHGSAILDAKFVSVESGQKSFDLVVRVSSLTKGKRIDIPTRSTSVINKWLDRGFTFIQGCCLSSKSLTLWLEKEDTPLKVIGEQLGIDLGVNKLLACSDGSKFGAEFKAISEKIRRKRPGSKGKLRALRHRDNYINQAINKIPFETLSLIAVEDLKGLKKGKKPGRGRAFRKALAPWVYRKMLDRIEQKAEENRVRLRAVSPAYTSQRCPDCGTVDKLNRSGEVFLCVSCGHKGDADVIGAQNILSRAISILGSVESPWLIKKA